MNIELAHPHSSDSATSLALLAQPDPDVNAPTSPAASSFPHFVHLRLHSEYSIVDGLVRIDDVIKAATKDKQAALALKK